MSTQCADPVMPDVSPGAGHRNADVVIRLEGERLDSGQDMHYYFINRSTYAAEEVVPDAEETSQGKP